MDEQRNLEIQLHFTSCIHMDLEFEQEIHMDLPILEMTQQELVDQVSLLNGSGKSALATRRDQVVYYHFMLKRTIMEISEIMKIPVSTVGWNIQKYRREILSAVKTDLRTNKKILSHMVNLMVETEQRTRELWKNYAMLEADVEVLRATIRRELALMKDNPNHVPTASVTEIDSAIRTSLSVHSQKAHYLSLVREETKMMLQIWKDFGLTGDEARKIVLEGGIDIEMKITEVKTFVHKLFGIIKSEVKDDKLRMNTFNRIANEIRATALFKDKPTDDWSNPHES